METARKSLKQKRLFKGMEDGHNISDIQERGKGHIKELQRHNTPKHDIQNLRIIINDRLKSETKEKLPEEQFGFRQGRGTLDAIFIIN